MRSVLSLFGEGLTDETVRDNWPARYAESTRTVSPRSVVRAVYTDTEIGDGTYLQVDSSYDKDHASFLPAVLRSVPGAELAVLTQMNDTTDSGVAWAYRLDGDDVEYLGEVHSEEGQCGRDVVAHYRREYGVRIWTLWEALDQWPAEHDRPVDGDP